MNWNTLKWKLMERIREESQPFDGYLFGGYVNGLIRHNNGAKSFYASHMDVSQYSNPSFHTESISRLEVPDDMDMVFRSKENVTNFFAALNNLDLDVKIMKDNLKYVTDNNKNIQGSKVSISFVSYPWLGADDPFRGKKITMDVIYPITGSLSVIDILLRIGKLDFDVNGLILSPSNDFLFHPMHPSYSTLVDPLTKMENVKNAIDNIMAKKATKILGTDVPNYRVQRMLTKGWTLEGDNNTLMAMNPTNEDCVICAKGFKNTFGIKGGCCKVGWVHPCCYNKYVQEKKRNFLEVNCMFCRAEGSLDKNFY